MHHTILDLLSTSRWTKRPVGGVGGGGHEVWRITWSCMTFALLKIMNARWIVPLSPIVPSWKLPPSASFRELLSRRVNNWCRFGVANLGDAAVKREPISTPSSLCDHFRACRFPPSLPSVSFSRFCFSVEKLQMPSDARASFSPQNRRS